VGTEPPGEPMHTEVGGPVRHQSPNDQLVKYLADAHSLEKQALEQLTVAPKLAGDGRMSAAFAQHLGETEHHERMVRQRLDELGGSPSKLKDIVMAAGGKGFMIFARLQHDTPGKLLAHAYSYEHLEQAAYRLLALVAERADDLRTTAIANDIAEQERLMSERLVECYDEAVEDSLSNSHLGDLGDLSALLSYLADVHAIEQQAIVLLEHASTTAGDPLFTEVYERHLEQSREHAAIIKWRLAAHDARPSTLKDSAMRLGGLNWSVFFRTHPDTPGKLAVFTYAFEHLEIASYELLSRVAGRVGDDQTHDACEQILMEERVAADAIAGTFERAADASLSETTARP
jgi:ferritin-like metal-binding protein YciE